METQKIATKLYDKDFRGKIRENPKVYAKDLGYMLASDATVQVITNSKNKFYIAIPAGSDEIMLKNIQAAVKLGTAASVGSLSTLSCIGSTVLSAGTVATAGTAAKD